MRSGRIGGLADIAQVLQHAAGIGEGRMLGNGLMREPVGDVLGQGQGPAPHEQDAIQFHAETETLDEMVDAIYERLEAGRSGKKTTSDNESK